MKKLLIILILICGCGSGNEKTVVAPTYSDTVSEWTFKGDSMAYDLGIYWGEGENNGSGGASIEFLLSYPDTRPLKNVVLWVGVNSIHAGTPIDDIVSHHQELHDSIKAERIYCVGVPYVNGINGYDSSLWPNIAILNAAIETKCGKENYVDIESIPVVFTSDGIHPDDATNELIKGEILSR